MTHTEGTGAGADQEIGEAAAEEALAEIRAALAGARDAPSSTLPNLPLFEL